MAREGLLSLCFLILLKLQVHRAHGSSRGLYDIGSPTSTPPGIGLCDSSVIKHGYKCEENYVTTKDGYILNMQRISEGRVPSGNNKKQPVLLQHGILVDGLTWLINQPEQNLPFILADNGFDVWISNTRGTTFSRRHTYLDPDKKDYWNWSWDELAAYDLPAFIDYIYDNTGQEVNYVGHSLGTLTALASLSEGLLQDRLKSAVLLTPIAYMSHLKTPLVNVAAKAFLGEIVDFIGMSEFKPKGRATEIFLRSLCADSKVNCYDFVTALSGKNCCLNSSTIDLNLKNEPQPTSTKNLVHLAQIIRHNVISKYDEGFWDNLHKYWAMKPPAYNLSKISRELPLYLSYGGNDALSDAEDVNYLIDILGKSRDEKKLKVQYVENYGHLDFVMAVNAKDIVYNEIVSFFKQ